MQTWCRIGSLLSSPLPNKYKTKSIERERVAGGCWVMAASKIKALWYHPAGPKTIFFWAPTFKWGLSIANVADFSQPPEKISYPNQIVLACSGVIWARYSTVITPKNWNLLGVNAAMAGTAIYQLTRKLQQDYYSDTQEAPAKK